VFSVRFESFLSATDAKRAQIALRTLDRHGFAELVMTGGFAVETHRVLGGRQPIARPLVDIDFLVDRFEQIPRSMSGDFLFLHVHPYDPPAKTLLQAVDQETSVRVDVFGAYGSETERAIKLDIFGSPRRLITRQDLVARAARLSLDLVRNKPVTGKYTRDFLRLLPLVEAKDVEQIWPEHRKPDHPTTFAEASSLLTELIPARADLQGSPVYSVDAERPCPRCESTASFPLANRHRMLTLLGYC
jgi:hypothetical protein